MNASLSMSICTTLHLLCRNGERERERVCVCVHACVCECVYVRMCVYCKRVFVCVASAISNVVKSRGHADLYNSWNTGLHWSWLYRQTQEDRDLT